MYRLASLTAFWSGFTLAQPNNPLHLPIRLLPTLPRSSVYHNVDLGMLAQVVFLGDSITDHWGSREGTWSSSPGWVNRGAGGQTSQQFFLRERHDAVNLHPKAIVLEGGGNDTRLGFSPEEIRDNILNTCELAESHGIHVYRDDTGLRLCPATYRLACGSAHSSTQSPASRNLHRETLGTIAVQSSIVRAEWFLCQLN